MSAPKGNRFWEVRTKHGRDRLFQTPEILWQACVEYFYHVEDNPLHEAKAFAFQGEVTIEKEIPMMRAMTMDGLCTFLDIGTSTWADYRDREGYSEVIEKAERVMRDQKFTGAAANLLNANIIARDLGLADKKELGGPDGGAIHIADMSEREIARRIAFALSKAANGADA